MSGAAPTDGPPPGPAFGLRLAGGLLGVLMAAMLAGLNNRVGALGLADIRGAHGWSSDDASWLSSVYLAGELAVMPFATWCAITFSLKRFQFATLGMAMLLAVLMPWVNNLPTLLVLRGLQGFFCGAQIPVLMMVALRFLPPPIRLHGLALYALTATFAPNLAIWLTGQWVDHLFNWQWLYWQVIPMGMMAIALIQWGIPDMPSALPRLKQANWVGLVFGMAGLILIAIGLDQANRLDWWRSPWVSASLLAGSGLVIAFLITEWFHPAPFIKLQLLARRNLGLGFSIFFVLLITMLSGSMLPSTLLGHVQGFRSDQMAAIGLVIALPQLVLGPLVALLLYQRWVDARVVFALGFVCIALACWTASQVTSEWMVHEFLIAQVLQAIGQPMAVVPLLFLATSVVQPMEGPYVSGIVNTLRAFGTLFGSALMGRLETLRADQHSEMLIDHAGLTLGQPQATDWLHTLAQPLAEQATVLATADCYRVLGLLAVVLIPCALCMKHIPAPTITRTAH